MFNKTNSPLISVIVPVYKVENYLAKCIQSILSQIYENFELLLIDDDSPDNSLKICKQYQNLDSRIHIFSKPNGGVSSARNLGISHAKGKYICFIDSDDSVTPDYLKDLFEDSLRADEPCLIMHKYIVDNLTLEFNNRTLNNHIATENDLYRLVINQKLIRFSAPYAKLFDTDIIKRNAIAFPLGVHMGEDAIFLIRYLYFARTIVTSNKTNYLIYRREDSLMQTFNDFDSEFLAFTLWKESFLAFQKKFHNVFEDSNEKLLWDNIEDPLIRCIQSVYKAKSNLTITQQVNKLRTIPKTDLVLLKKYYEPTNIKNLASKTLLKYRAFRLYCILGKSMMRFQK